MKYTQTYYVTKDFIQWSTTISHTEIKMEGMDSTIQTRHIMSNQNQGTMSTVMLYTKGNICRLADRATWRWPITRRATALGNWLRWAQLTVIVQRPEGRLANWESVCVQTRGSSEESNIRTPDPSLPARCLFFGLTLFLFYKKHPRGARALVSGSQSEADGYPR